MTQNQQPLILCIDDDPDFLTYVRATLANAGYRVLEAFSAKEGLKLFTAHHPDMVIVDLMMEELDAGALFCKEIRKSGSSVPIYLLSSVGAELHQTTDVSELGFNGVLQKPLRQEDLLKIVKANLK
jgi:two-component system, OmpR family, KDP operon response regulator KdpE